MLSFIGADSPAYFDIQGKIEKTGADEITVPPLALRIDRQNLKKETDTILTAADSDGSFASFTLGENYYIYALQQSSDAEPNFVISINSTYPNSMPSGATPDENNTRKIGGFHYGRIRNIPWDDTATISVGILPNSVWDLENRPTCDPTGMAKVGDIWVDIYLASEGADSWPDKKLVSEYNATPVTGTEDYCWYDFVKAAANVGKRLLTYEEFVQVAYGSPEGHDGDNNAAWSDTSNSDRTATGTVEQAVSIYNIVDCVGNVWEWLNTFGTSSSGSWNSNTQAGKDSSYGMGDVYSSINVARAGGSWADGVRAGARALSLSSQPWGVRTRSGCRLVCDPL